MTVSVNGQRVLDQINLGGTLTLIHQFQKDIQTMGAVTPQYIPTFNQKLNKISESITVLQRTQETIFEQTKPPTKTEKIIELIRDNIAGFIIGSLLTWIIFNK